VPSSEYAALVNVGVVGGSRKLTMLKVITAPKNLDVFGATAVRV
jgi:hypothetical protein